MMRGPPAVLVIRPKFALPSVTFGLARLTLLKTLNDSMRTSTRRPLPTSTLRDSARSTVQNPGPRRNPFDVLPHEPGVFGPNAPILNHWFSFGSLTDGSPTMTGR